MKLPILRRTWRTPAALAAAAVAVAGVLTATAAGSGTTAATGPVAYNTGPDQGGCRTYDARGLSGFTIGVCINDRATGTTAYPDIYVNTARNLGLRETCRIDIQTWDDNNHKLGDTTTDCTTGHHTANPVKPNGPATVHTFAHLWFDGSSYPAGDSPSVSLAPNATVGAPTTGSDPVASALAETRQLTGLPDAFPPPVLVSQLISHIEALSDSDLDRYLTGVPRGDLNRLNKDLDSYFKNPLSSGQRMSFADNVLSRASQKTIASVDTQLQALQPPLASPASGWAPMTEPLYSGDGPSINDGGQRDIDDCYFHAELLATAAVDPGLIQSQIRLNANGTYSVKLYNGDAQPFWITVTADLPTGGTSDTYTYDDVTEGAWTAMYEKAFAQLSGGYDRITATGVQGLLIDGFVPITGKQPTTHQSPSLTEVAQAVAKRQPVVVSTVTVGTSMLHSGGGTINLPVDILDRAGKVTHSQVRDGLHYDHNYVIQSVDVKAGTVTLINPWGWNQPTPSGSEPTTPRILVHWNQPTGDPFTAIFPGDITLTIGELPR